MSNWDIATPDGTESAANGDDRIREMKSAIQDALQAQDPDAESVFPGSDTANPVYRYRGLKGPTSGRPAAGDYGQFFDSTRNVLQRDNGTSWEDIGTLIPAGTVMPFYQASAPVGWTKVVTQDDKIFRVVSGSGGGAGGSEGLAAGFTRAGHTHTISSDGVHTHTLASGGTKNNQNDGNGAYDVCTGPNAAGLFAPISGGGSTMTIRKATTDSQGAHTHGGATGSNGGFTISPAYVDLILASKD
jgi:hypothetical protein